MAVYPDICIDDPTIRIDDTITFIDQAYVPVGYLRAQVTKAANVMTVSGGPRDVMTGTGGPLDLMKQSGGPRGRAA